MSENSPRLSDYLLVFGYCIALYGIVLSVGGPLTMHEGVLSQTSRQMSADHDWLVPHNGEAPWLERPPLPQWITVGITNLVGRADVEWVMRIGPALSATLAVLMTVWLGGAFFGRTLGVLGGLVLATMYEFVRYATLAEADMFLCPIVTGAMTLFAYLEIVCLRKDNESTSFIGSRPWPVLAFFAVLGMTNLAKGLVFGTAMTLVPIGGFLLWNARIRPILRYVWLWGWLAFAAIALAWPIAAYQRFPDVLELWYFDLSGRVHGEAAFLNEASRQGTEQFSAALHDYLAAPWYYYAMHWFYVVAPWPLAGLAALRITARRACTQRESAERFLWCWALLTPLAFSFVQGKHHHYMLHFLPPWGILSALGVLQFWQRLQALAWMRLLPARIALLAGFAFLLGANWVGFYEKGQHLHRSSADTAFLRKVRETVPADVPLFLHPGEDRLEGLRMLFYCRDDACLLHNLSFIRDDRLSTGNVYLIARGKDLASIAQFGDATQLLQSEKTRREESPADRWTLYHVQLGGNLIHLPGPVRISPMQAMYRAAGPRLD